jgi:hypothetical protein
MRIDVRVLPHQYKALTAKERQVVMSMGIGSGKTALAALIAVISMIQGKRVLVIEPTYDQIKNVFMREVEKQMARYGLMIEGTKIWNLNSKNLRYMSGEILARSAEGGKSAFAGLDGIDTFIVDEASEISDFQIFTEGVNRQRKTKFPDEKKTYIVGTGCCGEHWLKSVSEMPDTLLLNASYHDNYFLDDSDLRDYDRIYGENTIFPKSYIEQFVYGQFVDSNEDSLFQELNIDAPPKRGAKVCGYDVAYSGKGDDSVIACMDGNILEKIYVRKTKGDTEMKEFQSYVDSVFKPDFWFYDSTGNAVVLKGKPVNFQAKGGQFANMRTKIYFDLKRRLREGIHIPEAVKNEHWGIIRQELNATTLNMDKETKLPILIPKEKIKEKLKRSPDRADALALTSIMPSLSQDAVRKQHRANSGYDPFNMDKA